MKYFAFIYAFTVVVTSGIAFCAYGLDKRWAGLGQRRIPEKSLHVLALLGGWPGALLGQKFFRHKTQKLSFRIVFWLTTLLHIAAVVAVIYLAAKSGVLPAPGPAESN